MQMTYMTAMRLNKTKILLGLVLLSSFLLRIIPIFANQIFFWFDQGLDMVLVKQLVVDHNISLTGRYSGLAGVLMGPLWTWILSIPFIIGSGHPAAIVIFFSLICTLSIVLTYIFVKKHVNPHSAIIVLIFLCFAPIYTYGSQIISSPHPLIFIFIFFIWLSFLVFIKKKPIYFVPLGFLIGLFFQFEIGFAIFTLPTVLFLIIGSKYWGLFKSKYFYIGIIFGLLTFIPQILFDIRHEFLITNSVVNLFTGKANNLYGTPLPIDQRLISRLLIFKEDMISYALFIKPWYLALALLCLSLVGWILVIKNRLRNELNLAKILLIILFGFYFGYVLYPGPLWDWYRLGLAIVYILLIVVPLGVLWEKFKPLGILAIILITLGINQSILAIGIERIINKQPIEDRAVLQNQLLAIDYSYANAKGKPFNYYAYTPPVYDYVWQYHLFWYAQKKYGYLPSNFQMGVPILGTGINKAPPKKGEGLIFLIMEPDHERPWQVNGWRKTFIKVGKVVNTSTFPGGIIVEERFAK